MNHADLNNRHELGVQMGRILQDAGDDTRPPPPPLAPAAPGAPAAPVVPPAAPEEAEKPQAPPPAAPAAQQNAVPNAQPPAGEEKPAVSDAAQLAPKPEQNEGEKADEKPAESPAQSQAEKPADSSGETPEKPQGETPAESEGSTPEQVKVETPEEKPGEQVNPSAGDAKETGPDKDPQLTGEQPGSEQSGNETPENNDGEKPAAGAETATENKTNENSEEDDEEKENENEEQKAECAKAKECALCEEANVAVKAKSDEGSCHWVQATGTCNFSDQSDTWGNPPGTNDCIKAVPATADGTGAVQVGAAVADPTSAVSGGGPTTPVEQMSNMFSAKPGHAALVVTFLGVALFARKKVFGRKLSGHQRRYSGDATADEEEELWPSSSKGNRGRGSRGGMNMTETVPLNSARDEEWGWEEGENNVEMAGSSSSAYANSRYSRDAARKAEEDLQLALALSQSQAQKQKLQQQHHQQQQKQQAAKAAAAAKASALAAHSASMNGAWNAGKHSAASNAMGQPNGGATRMGNNSKTTGQKKEEDIFATMGLSAKPTFRPTKTATGNNGANVNRSTTGKVQSANGSSNSSSVKASVPSKLTKGTAEKAKPQPSSTKVNGAAPTGRKTPVSNSAPVRASTAARSQPKPMNPPKQTTKPAKPVQASRPTVAAPSSISKPQPKVVQQPARQQSKPAPTPAPPVVTDPVVDEEDLLMQDIEKELNGEDWGGDDDLDDLLNG